jgi:hypothetical protein
MGSTEAHVVLGSAVAATAVVAAPIVVGSVIAGAIGENPNSNKESDGQPIPEEMKKQYTTPVGDTIISNDLLHRQPTYAPNARLVTNTSYDWLGLNASMFYVFDSGIDLQRHTGWGGSVEGFIILREGRKPWYSKVSFDLTYLETEARIRRGGARVHETIECYQTHINLAGGVRWDRFDIVPLAGIGFGFTDSSGTRYNRDGAYFSCDALVQAGLRLSYRPTDWCNFFVGYRVFWNISLEHEDYYDRYGREQYRAKSPSMSMQSVEAGMSLLF